MRGYSRRENRLLTDVARSITDGSIAPTTLSTPHSASDSTPPR